MDMNWVPGAAIGFLGSLTAWILAGMRFEVQTKADLKRAEEVRVADLKRAEELRVSDLKHAEELRADLRDMKRAWDDGIDRVGELAANMAGVQGTQNQININTTKTLDSLLGEVDRLKATVADHSGTLQLLVNVVMKK